MQRRKLTISDLRGPIQRIEDKPAPKPVVTSPPPKAKPQNVAKPEPSPAPPRAPGEKTAAQIERRRRYLRKRAKQQPQPQWPEIAAMQAALAARYPAVFGGRARWRSASTIRSWRRRAAIGRRYRQRCTIGSRHADDPTLPPLQDPYDAGRSDDPARSVFLDATADDAAEARRRMIAIRRIAFRQTWLSTVTTRYLSELSRLRCYTRRMRQFRSKDAFAACVARGMTMVASARACGITRQAAYLWLRDDPEFREKIADAREQWCDVAETNCLSWCGRGSFPRSPMR